MTDKALEAMKAGGDLVRRGSRKKPHKAVTVAPVSVIPEQNTETAIVTIKDNRKHPDVSVAQTVANMVFAGMTQETICRVLKMGMDTLYKHYKTELETGQAAIVNNISTSLAQRALAGSDTAAIFLLETRGAGKFTERNGLALTGKDGAPSEIQQRTEILNTVSGLLNRGITIDGEAEPLD